MTRIFSTFLLTAYTPAYLAEQLVTERGDGMLACETLFGTPGSEGPDRLRNGYGDALMGGPLRPIKQAVEEGGTDIAVLSQLTVSCPFYVVSAPAAAGTDPSSLDELYGFPLSEAPGNCLRDALGADDLRILDPATDVSEGGLVQLLMDHPGAGFLVPGDIAIPAEAHGTVSILVDLPASQVGLPFSALEVAKDRMLDEQRFRHLTTYIDEGCSMMREDDVKDLVARLGPVFPDMNDGDLGLVIERYREAGVWPATTRPDPTHHADYAALLARVGWMTPSQPLDTDDVIHEAVR